jgi:hypothetical protein
MGVGILSYEIKDEQSKIKFKRVQSYIPFLNIMGATEKIAIRRYHFPRYY